MPKLDLFLFQDMPPLDVIEVARLAEASNFQNLWLIDSQDAYPEIWTTAALCAVNTSRIRIGPGVTNPLTRHPQVTASAVLTLHEISRGRAILGLGTGDSAVQQLGWKPATVEVVGNCVALCRDRFKRKGADIPIYIAAMGQKITSYTCREADGIIRLNRRPTPEAIRHEVNQLRAVASAVGRDIRKLPIVSHLTIALSHRRQEALDDARGHLARTIKRLLAEPEGWPPELTHLEADARRIAEAYTYQDHMKSHVPHAGLVTDALVEALGLAGTPEEVLPRFKACWEEAARQERSGINFTVNITPSGKGRKRTFELFVKEVLPHLR